MDEVLRHNGSMGEVGGTDNDFSGGTVHGPVVQAGTVNGGIHVNLPHDQSESLLSTGRIVQRLTNAHSDDAATTLAKLDPDKAADVLALLPDAKQIEIVACMDSKPVAAILDRMPNKTSARLRLAARGSTALSRDAARWHRLLGDASGDFYRAGSSKRSPMGFASHYANGTVYWSERTGTGMVAGDIKKRYWKLGGFSGRLGYPIGSEKQAATSTFGTSGTFQRFESTWDYPAEVIEKIGTVCGATIYASEKGAFATWGGIGEYYEASGGTWGPLGFPVSEEAQVPSTEGETTELYRQEFEGGAVYWSWPAGAARVQPPIQEHHESLARLTLPLGDQQPATPSRLGTTGVFQNFQSYPLTGNLFFTIYSSGQRATWTVAGKIHGYYHLSGTTSGPFGFPRGNMFIKADNSPSAVKMQRFESGMIFSRLDLLDDAAIGLTGEAYELWLRYQSELGYPTTPERPLGEGPDLIQFFDNGVISVVYGTAQYWLSPGDASL